MPALKQVMLALLVCGSLLTACADDSDAGAETGGPQPVARADAAADPADTPAAPAAGGGAVLAPEPGKLYHGVFPFSGADDEESEITPESLDSYEQAAGRKVAWVYFSDDWYIDRDFPLDRADWIRERGSVPFIRLMLRSSSEQDIAEPLYTMDNIIAGDFDADLHAWFASAREYASPLIMEFGTEVNGNWFSWNGEWNGGGETGGYGDDAYPDGPERFRDAYRHIVDIAGQEGAENITWVFHFDCCGLPEEEWNAPAMYYPGDQYIDWLGLSVYGLTEPFNDEIYPFEELMNEGYAIAAALSADKPIVICEFGVTDGNSGVDQAQWAEEALTLMLSSRWPRLIGFSWWNENWEIDDDPDHDSRLMLQDNPELSRVFQRLVGGSDKVLESAVAAPAF